MKKFFIATIATGFFLISAQAHGVEHVANTKSKLKPVTISKVEKKADKKADKKVAKKVAKKADKKVAKKHIAKAAVKPKRKVTSISFDTAPTKVAAIASPKATAKAMKKPKANRMIASQKDIDPKKADKVIKK